jgi:hypothetical protein
MDPRTADAKTESNLQEQLALIVEKNWFRVALKGLHLDSLQERLESRRRSEPTSYAFLDKGEASAVSAVSVIGALEVQAHRTALSYNMPPPVLPSSALFPRIPSAPISFSAAQPTMNISSKAVFPPPPSPHEQPQLQSVDNDIPDSVFLNMDIDGSFGHFLFSLDSSLSLSLIHMLCLLCCFSVVAYSLGIQWASECRKTGFFRPPAHVQFQSEF